MMAKWAILSNGIVENVIEWDGVIWNPEHPELGGWTPPEGSLMLNIPSFVWYVPGIYYEDNDPSSGLYPHKAEPSKTWTYTGTGDTDGTWRWPLQQWQFSYVNGSWVKEDYS